MAKEFKQWNKDQIIKKLEDFNRVGREMLSYSFKIKCLNISTTLNYKKGEGITSNIQKPDDESIKAFCCDLRKFIQDNDSVSIKKINTVYCNDLIEESEKEIFREEVKFWKEVENEPTMFTFNNKKYLNKDIFEIFMYGNVVHESENNDNKRKYESLKNMPIFHISEALFIVILRHYLIYINNIMYVNNIVIEKLMQENRE